MDDDRAKQLLLEERARLEGLSRNESREDGTSELSTIDQHPADVGSETFERTKELALQEDAAARLEDVARAFEKLGDGSYGTCEACGGPIPEERLEAMPAARFCLEHQERQERGVATR